LISENPLVSIIAVCYNHSDWLRFTLDSIRTQSYSNLEVVLIDSNSSDDSYLKIQEYLFSNEIQDWKVHRQDKPTSICKNLNFALSQIKGEYYQVISCDDIILPDKIKLQIDHIQSTRSTAALIYGDYSHIDTLGNRIPEDTFILKKRGFSKNNMPPTGDVFCKILGSWDIHTTTCLINTKAAKEIGGYDENLSYEDTDFFLRLSRSFRFAAILDEVSYYRILPNSFFNSRSNEFYVSTCKLYLKHLDMDSCSKKVKRLATHYFDTLFERNPQSAILLFTEYASTSFEKYVAIYVGIFRISRSKFLSLKVKDLTKRFFK
jgi:glycosyltransferase involved in cell wall biosynthesis